MAVCSANLLVDIGDEGYQNDNGVFSNSEFGKVMLKGKLGLLVINFPILIWFVLTYLLVTLFSHCIKPCARLREGICLRMKESSITG